MRYSIANLGQAEPERYVSEGPADCRNVDEYRKAVENAAARIAYYQAAMQQAMSEENRGAADRASAGSDLANRDWTLWSKVLKNCGETPVAPVGTASQGSGPSATLIALLGLGLVTITALARPNLTSWLSKRR